MSGVIQHDMSVTSLPSSSFNQMSGVPSVTITISASIWYEKWMFHPISGIKAIFRTRVRPYPVGLWRIVPQWQEVWRFRFLVLFPRSQCLLSEMTILWFSISSVRFSSNPLQELQIIQGPALYSRAKPNLQVSLKYREFVTPKYKQSNTSTQFWLLDNKYLYQWSDEYVPDNDSVYKMCTF